MLYYIKLRTDKQRFYFFVTLITSFKLPPFSYLHLQLVTGVTLLELQSAEFQNEFTTSLARILMLPSSAVVISDINLNIESGQGFLVTYTVVQLNTTIKELSSALHASVIPLETQLINDGYLSALLGWPQVRYSYLPTNMPTFYPTITIQSRRSSPFVIAIIIVAIILTMVATIISAFWKPRITSTESVLAQLSRLCFPR